MMHAPALLICGLLLPVTMGVEGAEAAESVAVPSAVAPDAEKLDAAAALRIDEAIATRDAKTLAWAAHEAERCASVAVQASLRHALAAAYAFTDAVERRCVVDALLDDLLRARAPLSDDELGLLTKAGAHREQAIIAASFDAKVHETFLRGLLDVPLEDASWVAVCDLLASIRSPRLAAPILRPLKLDITLIVRDGRRGGGHRRMVRVFGDGSIIVPQGFPPDVLYGLALDPLPGDVVVAVGEKAVYARRTDAAEGAHGTGGQRIPLDRQQTSIDFLSDLLRPQIMDTMKRAHDEVVVTWSGPAAFTTAAIDARASMKEAWQRMVEGLQKGGLLTAEDAGALKPDIRIVVEDQRADTSVQIPGLPIVPEAADF